VATLGKKALRWHVFINCPFDDEYWPLLQATVFALLACGFAPRCAAEADDAGEERLEKISRIISECRLSIHDLSRKGPDPGTGLSRFNMPFELGLCVGAKRFGRRKMTLLVMETARFEYQKYLSDFAGRDIKHHADDPARVICLIRAWLNTQSLRRHVPGGAALLNLYEAFRADLPLSLKKANLQDSEITFVDWVHLIVEWFAGPAGGVIRRTSSRVRKN
jgi:hypothetical protein